MEIIALILVVAAIVCAILALFNVAPSAKLCAAGVLLLGVAMLLPRLIA